MKTSILLSTILLVLAFENVVRCASIREADSTEIRRNRFNKTDTTNSGNSKESENASTTTKAIRKPGEERSIDTLRNRLWNREQLFVQKTNFDLQNGAEIASFSSITNKIKQLYGLSIEEIFSQFSTNTCTLISESARKKIKEAVTLFGINTEGLKTHYTFSRSAQAFDTINKSGLTSTHRGEYVYTRLTNLTKEQFLSECSKHGVSYGTHNENGVGLVHFDTQTGPIYTKYVIRVDEHLLISLHQFLINSLGPDSQELCRSMYQFGSPNPDLENIAPWVVYWICRNRLNLDHLSINRYQLTPFGNAQESEKMDPTLLRRYGLWPMKQSGKLGPTICIWNNDNLIYCHNYVNSPIGGNNIEKLVQNLKSKFAMVNPDILCWIIRDGNLGVVVADRARSQFLYLITFLTSINHSLDNAELIEISGIDLGAAKSLSNALSPYSSFSELTGSRPDYCWCPSGCAHCLNGEGVPMQRAATMLKDSISDFFPMRVRPFFIRNIDRSGQILHEGQSFSCLDLMKEALENSENRPPIFRKYFGSTYSGFFESLDSSSNAVQNNRPDNFGSREAQLKHYFNQFREVPPLTIVLNKVLESLWVMQESNATNVKLLTDGVSKLREENFSGSFQASINNKNNMIIQLNGGFNNSCTWVTTTSNDRNLEFLEYTIDEKSGVIIFKKDGKVVLRGVASRICDTVSITIEVGNSETLVLTKK